MNDIECRSVFSHSSTDKDLRTSTIRNAFEAFPRLKKRSRVVREQRFYSILRLIRPPSLTMMFCFEDFLQQSQTQLDVIL